MIGGFDKVYEIGKVFWNEGIDYTHNPEFTMMEFYEAFGNSQTMKETTEEIIRSTVKALYGKLQVDISLTEFKS